MKELEFVITKQAGKELANIRKQAQLRQIDVGKRLGFSSKSGRVYISKLERGEIENPSMWLILKFLIICEKPWTAFFEKLANIYFNKKHWQIIEKVPAVFSDKKTDQAVAKYKHSMDTKFAYKQKIKPLTEFQKQKMATGYARHQAVMNKIEREITLFLGDSGEPYGFNQFYKAFARECYSILRKNKPQKIQNSQKKDSVDSVLSVVIGKWVKKGLKREILEKIKEIPIKYFKI